MPWSPVRVTANVAGAVPGPLPSASSAKTPLLMAMLSGPTAEEKFRFDAKAAAPRVRAVPPPGAVLS